METKIVYFDETGDDGNNTLSSSTFTLTSTYMYASDWQDNFNTIRALRRELKLHYNFPTAVEMHITPFMTDKSPYRGFGWSKEERLGILNAYISTIAQLKIETVNVIIDKTKIVNSDYPILENALKYNIQRIENTSSGGWNYMAISDKGRVKKMSKTAREIRVYNPIQDVFDISSRNLPIKYMFEDILEKDSNESYFIQVSDFISYFVHLYYKSFFLHEALPNRVANLITPEKINNAMEFLKANNIFNIRANHNNKYGLVIYPKEKQK